MSNEARGWLERARLYLSDAVNGNISNNNVCLLAQQCIEKSLKAALLVEFGDFDKVHDIDSLRSELPNTWEVTQKSLKRIAKYSLEMQCDLNYQVADNQMADEAKTTATEIFNSIEKEFNRRGE